MSDTKSSSSTESRVETIVIDTPLGKVRGRRSSGGYAFRGMRYAEAPVGDLRFRPPVPVSSWDGTQNATEYGPSALQLWELGEVPMPPEPTDEDCLFLNVTTPAVDGGKRPVLFWIHGGGYVAGSGRAYNGAAFTREHDVVVVTINYRLGALGFMHVGHLAPELQSSVNTGILDQICALEWTRDNIHAFGGDPNNITIFGESAGGTSTAAILGAPSADGLYHKAIVHSPHADLIEVGAGHEAFTNRCIERLGGNPETNGLETLLNASANDLAALNAPDAEASFKPSLALRRPDSVGFSPAIDGALVPRPIALTIMQRGKANVPVMGGGCRHEGTLFPGIVGSHEFTEEEAVALIDREGFDGARAMQVYEEFAPQSTPREKLIYMLTDTMFRNSMVRILDALAEVGTPVYSWMCSYESPDASTGLRATHAMELAFLWDWIGHPSGFLTAAGKKPPADLGRAMRAYWVSFAKDGAPKAEDEPDWPPYDTNTRSVLVLDKKRSIEQDYDGGVRRYWFGE